MIDYILSRDKEDLRDFKYSAPVVTTIPTSADIRNLCPPVYDQGQEGSCTANAGCAARIILNGTTSLSLSRAFLYYEERNLENSTMRDSGASLRDLCRALKTYGVCEENLMQYNDKRYTDEPSPQALSNALKYRINSYENLSSLSDIKKSISIDKTPVLLGMSVYESMESDTVSKTGKLPLPKLTEKNLGGHAVLIVGYKDATSISSGYLIIRNSWGSNWGDKGYFYMPYDYFNKYTFDYWRIK